MILITSGNKMVMFMGRPIMNGDIQKMNLITLIPIVDSYSNVDHVFQTNGFGNTKNNNNQSDDNSGAHM